MCSLIVCSISLYCYVRIKRVYLFIYIKIRYKLKYLFSLVYYTVELHVSSYMLGRKQDGVWLYFDKSTSTRKQGCRAKC